MPRHVTPSKAMTLVETMAVAPCGGLPPRVNSPPTSSSEPCSPSASTAVLIEPLKTPATPPTLDHALPSQRVTPGPGATNAPPA